MFSWMPVGVKKAASAAAAAWKPVFVSREEEPAILNQIYEIINNQKHDSWKPSKLLLKWKKENIPVKFPKLYILEYMENYMAKKMHTRGLVE